MGDAQWGNANAIQHTLGMIARGQRHVTTFVQGVESVLTTSVHVINYILGLIAPNRDALMIVVGKGIACVESVCVSLVLRVQRAKQILSGQCDVQRNGWLFLVLAVASGE